MPQMLAVDRGPQVVVNGERQLSPSEARLEELRKNLDTLRLKYTDQHPDVIATRQAIAQVQAELKQGSGGGSGDGGNAARRKSPIPSMTSSRSNWSTPRVLSPQRSAGSKRPKPSGPG